jgi:hypothetical protein
VDVGKDTLTVSFIELAGPDSRGRVLHRFDITKQNGRRP